MQLTSDRKAGQRWRWGHRGWVLFALWKALEVSVMVSHLICSLELFPFLSFLLMWYSCVYCRPRPTHTQPGWERAQLFPWLKADLSQAHSWRTAQTNVNKFVSPGSGRIPVPAPFAMNLLGFPIFAKFILQIHFSRSMALDSIIKEIEASISTLTNIWMSSRLRCGDLRITGPALWLLFYSSLSSSKTAGMRDLEITHYAWRCSFIHVFLFSFHQHRVPPTLVQVYAGLTCGWTVWFGLWE